MKKKKTSPPIIVRSGQYEFVKLNAASWEWRETYHWLLTLTWPRFALFLCGVYLVVNLVFATLYCITPCIAEIPRGAFPNAFFFSVETLATVGYGHMYPQTTYGHVVATLEIVTGMFGMAVVTGLIFVRFSRPTARIEFSRLIVVGPFDGKRMLMIRIANLRHQAMAEAEFHVMLARNEIVKEGEVMRRFYPLKLQFDRMIIFPVAITIRHEIDESSPLYGMTAEDYARGEVHIITSVICIDTVIPAPVQIHKDYTHCDIRFDHRFAEIYSDLDGGRLSVDYGRLHDIEPV